MCSLEKISFEIFGWLWLIIRQKFVKNISLCKLSFCLYSTSKWKWVGIYFLPKFENNLTSPSDSGFCFFTKTHKRECPLSKIEKNKIPKSSNFRIPTRKKDQIEKNIPKTKVPTSDLTNFYNFWFRNLFSHKLNSNEFGPKTGSKVISGHLRPFSEGTYDDYGFKIELVYRNFQRQNNLTVKFYGPGEFFDAHLVAPQKNVENF